MLRTLKDHLYQCPCKLSEEMIRCMAAVYCWLRSSASSNIEPNRSPLLLRSPTNVLPCCGINDDKDCTCKSMVEISSISTDNSNFSRASYAINNYRLLVEQLERVNVTKMETNAKIAFWINTYNSLIMHAYLAYGIPHSSLRKVALFNKAVYNIGGRIVSANAIEQSIFSFHTPRIGRVLPCSPLRLCLESLDQGFGEGNGNGDGKGK
ncbi:electron transporter, putative [Actinidia rufa]|uniref:Electron transporter, putative n=1 Tax=Actinidia rufa TaxID=165716 RepID=A0A7J0H0B0_9ERIC|nr:electron transporter, putative [Actinidia rufa]